MSNINGDAFNPIKSSNLKSCANIRDMKNKLFLKYQLEKDIIIVKRLLQKGTLIKQL